MSFLNNITTGDRALPLERTETFGPLSARRLLLLGGIALILIGMIFGDIFAVFVLHQNAARVGASLAGAAHAALAGDAAAVVANFQNVGDFLENRGTKVDTHVHMIGFGYLALMIALLAPWIALSAETKKRLAWLFLCGAGLLPICVFLIHYVGLAYSPLKALGWASIFADTGGLLVIVAVLGYLFGLITRRARIPRTVLQDELLLQMGGPGRLLLGGGMFLIMLGFLHGSYYAVVYLYRHEALDYSILSQLSTDAAKQDTASVDRGLAAYGELQGERAVNIAAHAHIIEFGMLSMLLAFFQPYVNLRESWKRRWALVLLLGSTVLPVCVLLELKYGLIAGGFADVGGVLVIVALLATWVGIMRYTGRLDAEGST
jgi:heme/copper-type cytochrome/quinol oxidase subunit 4